MANLLNLNQYRLRKIAERKLFGKLEEIVEVAVLATEQAIAGDMTPLQYQAFLEYLATMRGRYVRALERVQGGVK